MDFSNIHKISINDSTTINLLSYKEFEPNDFITELLPNEVLRLASIQNEIKKREFLATRMLRNSIFGKDEITYDSIGAPHIGAEKFLSISHTIELVGIAVSTYKVGFDLEPIRDKASRLSSKFLHDEENEFFDAADELEMTKVWSAKETLYKLAGRKGMSFKDELRLHKSEENWFGTIHNPKTIIHVPLRVFDSGRNVLTINSAPIEIKQRDI
jgi:4'-phosphopantetheinyl transferase